MLIWKWLQNKINEKEKRDIVIKHYGGVNDLCGPSCKYVSQLSNLK